jgi:hypothetical protein
MVILCIKFFTAVVLVAEAVVKVDEALVVEIEADNIFNASLEAAVSLEVAIKLDEVGKLDPPSADHQKIPPMMATLMIPAMIYILVSPFIMDGL